jgi:hypothetical protein
MEDVIVVAARAVRALQAADQEHSDSYRDQDGENIFILRKPMEQSNHVY